MEQNNNSIEVQIGKIVFNALLQNQIIYLPQVGSLRVDIMSAKLQGREKLLPPRLIVKYSPHEEGTSVVDMIVREGKCSRAVAQSIYDKWYNSSSSEGGVEIIGVGKVVNNRFNISSYLDNILNGELHQAIKLKRRRASMVWIGVSVVGCVVVGLIANMMFNSIMSDHEHPAVVEIERTQQQVVEVVQKPAPQVVEVEERVVEEVSTPPQPNIPVIANPRYRVAYGVFSVMENALKAEKIAHGKIAGIVTEIRPYGKMFLVSLHASDNISECQAFVNKHKDTFPDMWIYKRRN